MSKNGYLKNPCAVLVLIIGMFWALLQICSIYYLFRTEEKINYNKNSFVVPSKPIIYN